MYPLDLPRAFVHCLDELGITAGDAVTFALGMEHITYVPVRHLFATHQNGHVSSMGEGNSLPPLANNTTKAMCPSLRLNDEDDDT